VKRAPLYVAAAGALALTGSATASEPPQKVVLPGPVPYATPIPPLVGRTALTQIYLAPRLRVSSDQRVVVGIDGDGRPVALRVRQRLIVHGKGDYQLAIGGPIEDVRAAPGSESDPGLRADQLLWAGFSPARKVLSAEVTLQTAAAAKYLPLRVRLERSGDRVVLTVRNVTVAPGTVYAGTVRAPEIARLLDDTRRAALAGVRLTGAYATFLGQPRLRNGVPIEAPLLVKGELRLPGGQPVAFTRTLGAGSPLSFQVEARGGGTPKLELEARPVPVLRQLRPPGAASWRAALRRRKLPAAELLERLMETRLRLVRADQYQAFLADPDADGRTRAVYEFRTVAARAPRAAPSDDRSGGGGGNALLVALGVVGAVALAGGGLVLWAHN
jgi:hypothetical protein